MTLIDKLVELDQAIYHKCESVATKAYQHLGLGKYDLVRLTQLSGDMFWSGYGLYLGIAGTVEQSAIRIAQGSLLFLSGIIRYQNHTSAINIHEEHESYQLLRTDAIKTPRLSATRPFDFLMSAVAAGLATYLLIEGVPKSAHPLFEGNIENYSRAIAFAFYTGACSFSLWGLASYFQDTPMQPPKKKKIFKACHR